MSEIDPEKLESRIKEARKLLCSFEAYDMSWKPMLAALVEASEHALSTLPRVKEVEVAQWVVVDLKGEVRGCWDHEHQARKSVGDDSRLSVVRLTGTAKVRA